VNYFQAHVTAYVRALTPIDGFADIDKTVSCVPLRGVESLPIIQRSLWKDPVAA
jgi:hypothetical protein